MMTSLRSIGVAPSGTRFTPMDERSHAILLFSSYHGGYWSLRHDVLVGFIYAQTTLCTALEHSLNWRSLSGTRPFPMDNLRKLLPASEHVNNAGAFVRAALRAPAFSGTGLSPLNIMTIYPFLPHINWISLLGGTKFFRMVEASHCLAACTTRASSVWALNKVKVDSC